MRRILILVTSAAVGLIGAASAGASAAPAKLQRHRTTIGTILVDGHGNTVYAFSKDGRNADACARMAGCLGVWPLVAGGGKPVAGPGVKAALIGTITVKGGSRQLTYAGHTLYTYAGDSGPGDVSYVGVKQFGGTWPALSAAGREVK